MTTLFGNQNALGSDARAQGNRKTSMVNFKLSVDLFLQRGQIAMRI